MRLALTQRDITVGAKFEYSNFGYVIAGAMAERIENTSWEELMTRFVFRPARDGKGRLRWHRQAGQGRSTLAARRNWQARGKRPRGRQSCFHRAGRHGALHARRLGEVRRGSVAGVRAAGVGCFVPKPIEGFTRRRSAVWPRSAGVHAKWTA